VLATKFWFYTALSSDSGLDTVLGTNGSVTDEYPETIEKFPLVIYVDTNQYDSEFADNLPTRSTTRVTVHIYTKALTGYPTTTAVGVEVARIFRAMFFNCVSNGEVPDETETVRHRVMVFSRSLAATDLV
jgi:hypothetical protein